MNTELGAEHILPWERIMVPCRQAGVACWTSTAWPGAVVLFAGPPHGCSIGPLMKLLSLVLLLWHCLQVDQRTVWHRAAQCRGHKDRR